MSHWLYLFAAILLEVAGTLFMKFSYGFTRLVPSVLLFAFYGASFVAMTLALKRLDVSMAYAIWSGLGTALITIIGIAAFKEPASAAKLASIGLIIAGVVGLQISS